MLSTAQSALLRRLPKIELHLHLEGSIPLDTALDLARQNGVALPSPQGLYDYQTLDGFLAVYDALAKAVVRAQDFHRITYDMLSNCAASGARYVEFFISPHAHPAVPFAVQFQGIRAGMADAAHDFGITSAIIPGVNRELGVQAGQEYLDLILAERGDDLVGLGLDYLEAPHPPTPFAPLFARARQAGLHLTAHAGETGPASYIAASIRDLGVERIDHGYAVVEDPALMQQCKDSGILFTTCPSTTLYTTVHKDLRAPHHPIRRMRAAGLCLSLNSDDPPMMQTDLAREYDRAVADLGFAPSDLLRSLEASIDHAWVDDSTKRDWRATWLPEAQAILADFGPYPPKV